MGNCCTIFKFNKLRNNRNITILLTGLDYSGKTTIAKRLVGEPVDSVLKTVGFSLVKLQHHKYNVNIFDLGGSYQIRGIWSKYYMDAHGIIYVADASDIVRLHESKMVFAELLSHENISGKPILLLANKQDDKNAVDELDLVDQMNVEYIVNKYKCPTRVEICSALSLVNGKIDPGITNGYKWLIDNIIENYKSLNERVQCDMKNYALLVEKDREEWRRRIEAKEKAEPQPDEGPIINGNPFKPIDTIVGVKETEMLIQTEIGNGVTVNNISKTGNTLNGIHRVHKTDKHATSNGVTKMSAGSLREALKERKRKFMDRLRLGKKKFAKPNKTAPMPMSILIKNESEQEIPRNSSSSRAIILGPGSTRRLRPMTAPSSMRSFSNSAWDLNAPLEVATTSNSRVLVTKNEVSETDDRVSFF